MNTYNMVKQEFIKKWITTLQTLDSSVEYPSNVTERKNAIRLSSDIAIAATRSGSTVWSRALISRTGNKTTKPHMARRILRKARSRMKNRCSTLRRSGDFTARVGVRKRTELLKSLVPGGELIDDKDNLIRETLDYIVYLRVQVDVMRTLAAVDSVTGNL
ncbi:Transcription factor IBH1-like 1 [Cardamine amara subsp. amara]|uniref:Transcription factor IBH1-like 1 n=1 Tax=Cardamine amara subsp. amara TaxID=228776 RepID=A0ABD1BK19_CARAN